MHQAGKETVHRTIPQEFKPSDRVRFVGHPDHAAPPILEGTGQLGIVQDGGYGNLFRVKLDDLGTVVQLHAAQLEVE